MLSTILEWSVIYELIVIPKKEFDFIKGVSIERSQNAVELWCSIDTITDTFGG
jgi:hypothetical protein